MTNVKERCRILLPLIIDQADRFAETEENNFCCGVYPTGGKIEATVLGFSLLVKLA
jgi:hypothetical protein